MRYTFILMKRGGEILLGLFSVYCFSGTALMSVRLYCMQLKPTPTQTTNLSTSSSEEDGTAPPLFI